MQMSREFSSQTTQMCLLRAKTYDRPTCLLQGVATEEDEPSTGQKRKMVIPEKFKHFPLTYKLPVNHDAKNEVGQLRALTVEVLNIFNAEFENRFSEFNTQLWKSFESLNPSDTAFLDAERLNVCWNLPALLPLFIGKLKTIF